MNYWKIDKEDVCNGEGLRVVLWLSGCSHKCKGCQNPQTWDENSGIPFDEAVREELFRELDKDYISGLTLTGGDPLFEENLNDVLELVTKVNKRYNTTQDTVYVRDKDNNILTKLSHEIRLSLPQKSIWIYSGYKFEDCILKDKVCEENIIRSLRYEIIKQCTVMIDGRYIDSQRDVTLPWCGSSNQRVIMIQESLQKGEIVLWQT